MHYISKTVKFFIPMSNFWKNLKRPIFCLAPMEEVTDYAFREMFAKYSKVSTSSAPRGTFSSAGEGNNVAGAAFVMFTEFVNVDGLLHPEGFKKLEIDLKFSEAQRPIVAQIWGRDPEKFFRVAQMLAKMGFDGIDINFGCPQSKEIQSGTCAALIREPKLAQEIIAATQKGAGDIPVSVKTRLAYSKLDEMEAWVTTLLEMDIAALTLHARTKQEMSKVPAHWEKIAEAVEIRDKYFKSKSGVIARSASDEAILPNEGIASSADKALPSRNDRTLIIGNGDIKSRDEGLARIIETKCDGVMIARGAFGNPWLFRADNFQPDKKERFRVMLEHAALFDHTFSGRKSFVIMRKHFKAYCSGFPGANELRAKLMLANDLNETKNIVEEYLRLDINGY